MPNSFSSTTSVQPPSSLLSPDAKRLFAQSGWIFCPNFFDARETGEMSDWIDELYERPEIPGAHWVYRQPSLVDDKKQIVQRIENFCPHHPGMQDLATRSRLTEAAMQLLGGKVHLFKEKINFKEPGGAGFELHQDQQAGWSRYAPLFVTAMICIDPCTPANGCLEIADSRQRLTGLIGEEWKPLGEDQAELTALPMEPGDLLFFDSFVPHASAANFTDRRRRVLFFTYNAAIHGDQREAYHRDKRASFPPDIERDPNAAYKFRV